MKLFVEKIRESKPTLVVFQHVGNQDAVEVKYLVEDLQREFGDTANVVTVDASYNGGMKVDYKIKEFPTWILFKEGQELMRESGKKSAGDLEDMIRRGM